MDKDDIDALKMMKVDCLAGMKRGLDLLAECKGIELDLASRRSVRVLVH